MDASHPSLVLLAQFQLALERILRVSSATVIVSPDEDVQPALDDVWRLSVVTLHASFEAALRELARENMYVDPQVAMETDIGKKILKEILREGESSVDEGYRKAVDEFLDTRSLSHVGYVDMWIRLAGIGKDKLTYDRAAVSKLIERRHRIVHRADLDDDRQAYASCDQSVLMAWIGAVGTVVCQIFVHAVSQSIHQGRLDAERGRQLQRVALDAQDVMESLGSRS